jgi:hypothetical protein
MNAGPVSRFAGYITVTFHADSPGSTPIADRHVEDRFINLSQGERAVYDADGEQISRGFIERVLVFPIQNCAVVLKWWDEEYAAMERRAVECGYKQAVAESEAACKAMCEKEHELADVQAATFAGAIVRLETALDTIVSDEPSTYEQMALGALQNLKRLAGKAVQV